MKLLQLSLAMLTAGLALNAQAGDRKPYIVMLKDAPAATYDGSVSGYTATAPAHGRKFAASAQHVQRYLSYLNSQVAKVTASVPNARVVHRYGATVTGFSALLSEADVAKLRANPAVEMLQEDKAEPLMTSFTTSRFLGLGQSGGAWSQVDANGRQIKGEDVIIGIVDSGIWPENPSFSDRVDASGKPLPGNVAGGSLAYAPLPAGRWNGSCQTSVDFPASSCNNKLIGARYYDATWRALGSTFLPEEFVSSSRDSGGHGTHVASTAGGNANAEYVIGGSNFSLTGVAPRARIASYKACWLRATATGTTGSCYNGDRQAAIEQAVLDGVDVINHSIGLDPTLINDIVSIAMRNAVKAGVFVATAAGNDGPGNTANGSAPWVATVAASTHSRTFEATLTLGNGSSVSGASWQSSGLPAGTQLILSTNAGVTPYASLANDADRLALARCYNASDRSTNGASSAAALDPAKIAGKLVVCYRGGNTFVNKVDAVSGAAGLVIQNMPAGTIFTSADTTFANVQPIPTLHLKAANANTVLAYGAGANPTARLFPRVENPNGAVAPVMADFSSRGPNLYDLNVLKPDFSGPGVEILAAYMPEKYDAAMHDAILAGATPVIGAASLQGTSMATPHVAGAAALVKQAHPNWSASAIKSALMTSATNNILLSSGAADTNRFAYGAGHMAPNAAVATTLVYDISDADYVAYTNQTLSGSALNLPSLTDSGVLGITSLTRRITNTGSNSVTLSPSFIAPPGFTLSVSPSTLSIAPGATASYTLRATRSGAALGSWQFGEMSWNGGGQSLRSPISLRSMGLVATTTVTDTRLVGSRLHTVGVGFNGSLNQRPTGMVAATRNTGRVAKDGEQCFPVEVPASALLVRAQLFNADTEGGALTDLDLTLYDAAGAVVAASGSSSSDELVSVSAPAAGSYSACVVGYAVAAGLEQASFTLSSWVLNPASNPGTLKVSGGKVVRMGANVTLGATWAVAAGNRHLGLVQYAESPSGPVLGATTFLIDPLSSAASTTATMLRRKSLR